MVPVPSLRRSLRDDRWRYSLLAGLLLSLMAEQALQMTGDYNFGMWPVFAAGLVVGLLYDGPPRDAKRVGVWAGVIASLPVYATLVWTAVTHVGSDPSISYVMPALFIVVLGIPAFLAFYMLTGLLGALLGCWIAGEVGRPRLPGVGA